MKINRLVAVVAAAMFGTAFAQTVPDRITFNARLADTGGAPVTGSHALTFALFSVANGGTASWSESYPTASFTTDGLVFLELGSTTPLTSTILDGSKLYMEITVDGTPMLPRVGVVSVPYAIRASEAVRITNPGFPALTAATIQQRVTGTCAVNSSIRVINADGTVVCEVDDVGAGGGITGATTSGGLVATGTTLGLLTSCTSGQVLKAGAGGTWACANDTDTTTTYTAAANGGIAVVGTTIGIGNCTAGQIMKSTGANTWGCAADVDTDTNTTYTATVNGGLALVGTTFGIGNCTAGQVMKSTGASTWGCAADNGQTYTGTDFIVNGTGQQAASNFNISGTGVIAGNVQIGVNNASQPVRLTVRGAGSTALTGTVSGSMSMTNLNGFGTSFTTELVLGDRVVANGMTRVITAITSNTLATVDLPWTTADFFNVAFVRLTDIAQIQNSAGTNVWKMDTFGAVTQIRRIARVQGAIDDATDNGVLVGRSVVINKVNAASGIRVQWSDNFRVLGNGTACRWQVYFNGFTCNAWIPATNNNVAFDKYEGGTSSNRHDPTTVTGTCFVPTTGAITVSTRVGPAPGYGVTDCDTGWQGGAAFPNGALFSIEAEEVF